MLPYVNLSSTSIGLVLTTDQAFDTGGYSLRYWGRSRFVTKPSLYMDAVPRVGDTINFGDYEGEVIKVTHVPVGTEHGKIRYRDEDEPGTQVLLSGSHLVKPGRKTG